MKHRLIHKLSAIVAPLILSTLISIEAFAEMNTTAARACAEGELQQWPLPMMSRAERETRLKWFSNNDALKVVYYGGEFDKEKCNKFLHNLQYMEKVVLLNPDFSSPTPNINLLKSPILSCPRLDLEREYPRLSDKERHTFDESLSEENSRYPHMHRQFNYYSRDNTFLNLPKLRKEQEVERYVEAAKNIEIYNLEKYLGDGVWGYFAEAGHIMIKTLTDDNVNYTFKPLIEGIHCFPHFEAIQKVVNKNSCATAYDPYLPVKRISSWTYVGEDLSGSFANASFSAFVEYEHLLYRISVYSIRPMHSIQSVVGNGMAPFSIYIDSITNKDNNLRFKHVCSVSTYK